LGELTNEQREGYAWYGSGRAPPWSVTTGGERENKGPRARYTGGDGGCGEVEFWRAARRVFSASNDS